MHFLCFGPCRLWCPAFSPTWARLLDPAEPMFVLGAFDAAGKLVGIDLIHLDASHRCIVAPGHGPDGLGYGGTRVRPDDPS